MSRLLEEIEKGLNAEYTKFFKDESLGEFEDNTNRQRARELLADLLGVRKQKLDLHHSGDESLIDILTSAHAKNHEPGSG